MCTHSVSHRGAQRRALAKARAVRAVELAAAGKTYAAIADVLGYADRGTVHRIVRKELEARSAESVDLLRSVEVARLDALQCGLWDQVMSGDPASCAAMVRIIDQHVRLLGVGTPLAQAGATERPADVAQRTVVQVPHDPGAP